MEMRMMMLKEDDVDRPPFGDDKRTGNTKGGRHSRPPLMDVMSRDV